MKKSYAEKLKDPRWQKRRLQIMERDGWRCTACGGDSITLHVHHRWYEGEPWEAPDEALTTFCELCHNEEYERRREYEAALLDILRRRLDWYALEWLRSTLEDMPAEIVRELAEGGVSPRHYEAVEDWLRAKRTDFAKWSEIQKITMGIAD